MELQSLFYWMFPILTFLYRPFGSSLWPCRTAPALYLVRGRYHSVFEVLSRAAKELECKRDLLGSKFQLAPLVLATSVVASYHEHKNVVSRDIVLVAVLTWMLQYWHWICHLLEVLSSCRYLSRQPLQYKITLSFSTVSSLTLNLGLSQNATFPYPVWRFP